MRRLLVLGCGLFMLIGIVRAQTPVRDQARVQNFGTATVRGVVITDDAARAPLRRATVVLTRTGIEDIRVVATDDNGAYVFDRLPAATYTLSASKAAYISISYGAPKPGMPGSAITLADGQTFTPQPMALIRGAVIAGKLTDQSGRPVTGSVRADQIVTVNGVKQRRTSTGATSTARSNAHGEYRIYGLLPGEYAVSATASPTSAETEITPAELSAVSRDPVAPAKPRRSVTLAPTLFPGTADTSSAIPVKVARGEERIGVDFSMQYVPVARVSGRVVGVDGRAAPNASVLCQVKEPNAVLPPNGVPFSLTTADGSFSCSSLLPTQYRIYARVVPQPAGTAAALWGWADLDVAGVDISNLVIRAQPGVTLAGKVVLNSANATIADSQFLIRLIPVGSSPAAPPTARTAADGTFQVDGVVPDTYRLAVTPAALMGLGPWSLRSAMLGDKDVADQAFDVAQPTTGLVVTFTDTPTELSGALTDGAGRPGPQLYVFAFPQDRSLWLPNSRRVMSVRSTDGGAYKLAGLPPGDYYVCALTELDTALQTDPAYLEQLVAASITLTLGDGEKKRQDLAIR